MDTAQIRYENAVLAEQCSEVFNAHPPLKVYEKRAGVYLEVPDDKTDDFKRSLADRFVESQRKVNAATPTRP